MQRTRDWNNDANPEPLRVALKLATRAGKTTVMGYRVADVEPARTSGSSRFTDAFLVMTPGITIKDRLRVLQPSDATRTGVGCSRGERANLSTHLQARARWVQRNRAQPTCPICDGKDKFLDHAG